MTSRDFCYWLQGFLELSMSTNLELDRKKVQSIKNHLNMVFKHEIDPSHGDQKHQEELSALHGGVAPPQSPKLDPSFMVVARQSPDARRNC